jgi:tripartite-type tricarboxylate transporter receptor subunit TctC
MPPRALRALLKGAVAGALCLAGAALAAPQDLKTYPTKPVRIVVPYAAGGGTDALARFLAQGLEKRLGQPFIIENRPGQATATGAAYVARRCSRPPARPWRSIPASTASFLTIR